MNTGVASQRFVTWLVAVDRHPAADRQAALGRLRVPSRRQPDRTPRRRPRSEDRRGDEARRSARPDRDAPRSHHGVSPVARRRARDRGGVEEAGRARTSRSPPRSNASAAVGIEHEHRAAPDHVRPDRRRRARRRRARRLPHRPVHDRCELAPDARSARIRRAPRSRRSSIPRRRATPRSTPCARWSSTESPSVTRPSYRSPISSRPRSRSCSTPPGRRVARCRRPRRSSKTCSTVPIRARCAPNEWSRRSRRLRTRRRRSPAESSLRRRQRWDPDLRTMETVITALRTLPLVQSATLDEMFAGISNEQALGTDVQRRLVPGIPPPTPVDLRRLQLDREQARGVPRRRRRRRIRSSSKVRPRSAPTSPTTHLVRARRTPHSTRSTRRSTRSPPAYAPTRSASRSRRGAPTCR